MSHQEPCPGCNGRGGEIVEVKVDPNRNGDPGNVRQEFIKCDRCDGSGSIEVPDDDDDDDDDDDGRSGSGGRRR